MENRQCKTDLAIIGTGLAGCAATIFALNRGLSVAQAGNTGAIAYTTGYFDLLGAEQGDTTTLITDPWQGLNRLRTNEPRHPLARISDEDIQEAFTQVLSFIGAEGIGYVSSRKENVQAITPAGTSKPTFAVPATMAAGVRALRDKRPCLIVDFKGLRGFSSREVVANLRSQWPNLEAKRLIFPDSSSGEIYPEVMARALEVPATQDKLAEKIKEVSGDAEVIGMPAILGIHHPDKVLKKMESLVGKALFEIPTMPPSVAGIRLREMIEQVFPTRGVELIAQQKIHTVEFVDDSIKLHVKDTYGSIVIEAKSVILASGRFLSGGLTSDMHAISEPLLGLHIAQPKSRDQWFCEQYMASQGHEAHRAGILVDDLFRVLDGTGKIVDPRLFAAGTILANQDWIRQRCGAGVALATAYRAVQGVEILLNTAHTEKNV
ncbi:MAG: anaerobic glycerol-3-phosphate dehydrogenase subunit B [Deltaproteobacteria bacterium]|nr:MAG: anaerobic glycerol-3-phosphate dehydrogenase subunit B [Desulfobacterales bacterium]PIE72095.1 MAG: anaerobic glycerol-3-phosphate dehydrogenase subunit B [Deltaproteobacteria bacterium]